MLKRETRRERNGGGISLFSAVVSEVSGDDFYQVALFFFRGVDLLLKSVE
jgi:hypothetical protein